MQPRRFCSNQVRNEAFPDAWQCGTVLDGTVKECPYDSYLHAVTAQDKCRDARCFYDEDATDDLPDALRAAVKELNERGFWVIPATTLCRNMCDHYIENPTEQQKKEHVVNCGYSANASGRCLQHWCVYGAPLHFSKDGRTATGFTRRSL